MENQAPQPIKIGRLTLSADGPDMAITMPSMPGVRVVIPARQVEAWGLRKLREAVFSPAAIETIPTSNAA